MNHLSKLLILWFGLALSACASAPEAQGSLDCVSPELQNAITFCASPAAAELARTNTETAKVVAEGADPDSQGPVSIVGAPVLGNPDAPVTLVVFTDLQCPYCSRGHEVVKQLVEESGDDLRVVFKHMPLPFHPNAVPAALGAVAAGNQGKFWEFVDLAFKHQDALEPDQLVVYAQELGLDVEKFKTEIQSPEAIDVLRADVIQGQAIGVRGTPTFFMNGERFVGAMPIEEFKAKVASHKTLHDAMMNVGVKKQDSYWRLASINFVAPEPLEPQPEPEPEPETTVTLVPVGNAPQKGASKDAALVTIVEFSDFECPFCRRGTNNINAVLARYESEVRLAYRHFPLDFHPNATPAAVLSVAAAEKGKFWEFHDAVFALEELNETALLKIAKGVGIDETNAKEALGTEKFQNVVVEDMKLGSSLGVRGTPNFFINGIMISGAQPEEVFEGLIATQVELAKIVSEETGLKGQALYEQMVELNQKSQE